MKLDITSWYTKNSEDAMDYSASAQELGRDAGKITFNNSLDSAEEYPELLDTEEKRNACQEYFLSFGAWEHEEIIKWSNVELIALLIQFIAANIRNAEEETIYQFEGRYYMDIGN